MTTNGPHLAAVMDSDHADDAALARLLDGEAPDAERPALERHVRECARCATRFGELTARSAALRSALAEAPPSPVPPSLNWDAVARRARDRVAAAAPSRRRALLWQTAAGLLLLVSGVAFAAPAVRGWVRRALAPAPPASRVVEAPPSNDATAGGGGASRVAFGAGRDLTIAFDARPAAGMLEVLTSARDGDAEVEVVGADAAAARIVVVPGEGLVVHNTPASTQSYRVRVPASVVRITLRVGGRSRVLRPGAAPMVIELGGGQD